MRTSNTSPSAVAYGFRPQAQPQTSRREIEQQRQGAADLEEWASLDPTDLMANHPAFLDVPSTVRNAVGFGLLALLKDSTKLSRLIREKDLVAQMTWAGDLCDPDEYKDLSLQGKIRLLSPGNPSYRIPPIKTIGQPEWNVAQALPFWLCGGDYDAPAIGLGVIVPVLSAALLTYYEPNDHTWAGSFIIPDPRIHFSEREMTEVGNAMRRLNAYADRVPRTLTAEQRCF
jgi:hypothetical protein